MNIEDLRLFCLSVPGTEECLPFDEVTLVYKVMGIADELNSYTESKIPRCLLRGDSI